MPRGDIAVRAFLKYARLGLDRRELSALYMPSRIRSYCSSDAEAERLLAVYEMFRILRAEEKRETEEAVRAVYFSGRGRTPRKNDITYAVRRFAVEKNIDDRTVWRRIEYAKNLYRTLILL